MGRSQSLCAHDDYSTKNTQKYFKQFQSQSDRHHRIHSECGPFYTEHSLREHSSVCQQMSGDWDGTL
jgi:hypothetical protein